jgi:thymidylate kinase
MDRGPHTLLAHRFTIEHLTGLAFFEPARQALSTARLQSWPHLIIYLDTPQKVILDRNKGKFPPSSVLIDATFNAAVRTYFATLAARYPTGVAWLDATLDPGKLVTMAQTRIGDLLSAADATPVPSW